MFVTYLALIKRRHLYIKLVVCTFLFSLVYSTARAKNGVDCDVLRGKRFDERYEALCFLYEDVKGQSDQVIKNTLNELEQCALEKNDEELRYAYRLLRYHVYITEEIHVAAFEDSIALFLHGVEKKKYRLLRADALALFASYHWQRTKEYGPGFEYQLSAYHIYKDVPVSAFPPKYTYLYELAMSYYSFGDYDNAKKILAEAAANTGGPDCNKPQEYNLLNLLGLCYRNTGNYDSALLYFARARGITDSLGRDTWTAILDGNIGITYYMQKRYREAIPLLETDIRTCLEGKKALENVPKSMAILADAYMAVGQTAQAVQLLEQAKEVLHMEHFWHRHDVLHVIYPIMARVYNASGQRDKAYAFLDSALAQKDSFYTQFNALILAGVQHKIDVEKNLADVQQLTAEKELERITKYAWVTGILLMAGIIILFINRQKILHRRRSERMEAEKKQVEAELANATIMLNNFTSSVHEKNELIEKFTAEIERLQGLSNGRLPDDYNETLLQLQDATILTDEQWEDFRRMFEKVHAGYLNRLKMKLPGLSPAETRIMALSKLKLSNKEMAGMLGISPDAVRMSKHRLRKKLDLTEEGGIDELADMI